MSYENKYLDLFIKHKEAVDAIIDQSVKIEKLEHEIEVLRQFGNKDCTAMADSYLSKEVKAMK